MAGALCAVGIALGNWQSDRAEEKRAIAQRIADFEKTRAVRLGAAPVAAEDYLWRKVEVHGEFDPQRTLFLGNRLYRGRPGYYVVTPLRIENAGRYVLVLRGWKALGDSPPVQAVPPGMRVIRGLAVPRVAHMYEPGAPGHDRVRQNIDIAGFESESALPLQPLFIEQRGEAEPGLVQDWPAHDALLDKHRMYAGQWYSLAALSIGIFLVLSFRHGRRTTDA